MPITSEISSDLPQWILAWGTIGIFIFGTIYKIFMVDSGIKNHGKRLTVLEDACSIVQGDLVSAMTAGEHSEQCKDNNRFMCKKVQEVRESVDGGHRALARRMDQMDQSRENAKKEESIRDAARALQDIKIATVLGRVEEHLKNSPNKVVL